MRLRSGGMQDVRSGHVRTQLVVLCLIFMPGILYAWSGGPPNGKTGAPGEGTCADCHVSFPLNSGPGAFSISAPSTFQAGEGYQITISLEQSAQQRWGFEFTPLDVGTVTITDPTNTQQDTEFGKLYVKQTSDGTHLITSIFLTTHLGNIV